MIRVKNVNVVSSWAAILVRREMRWRTRTTCHNIQSIPFALCAKDWNWWLNGEWRIARTSKAWFVCVRKFVWCVKFQGMTVAQKSLVRVWKFVWRVKVQGLTVAQSNYSECMHNSVPGDDIKTNVSWNERTQFNESWMRMADALVIFDNRDCIALDQCTEWTSTKGSPERSTTD